MSKQENTLPSIFLFLDLDDSLFQTRRKNPNGVIPATQTEDPTNVSYMTRAQQLLFELFSKAPQTRMIPVTARDFRQYHKTFLSQREDISTSVLYFGGAILHGGEFDAVWRARIQETYRNLSILPASLLEEMRAALRRPEYFKLFNVDDYYATVKAVPDCPAVLREEVFSAVRALCPEDYLVHENGRALSLLPLCIDKREAVNYLLEKHRPELSIGMGDSFTDWPFMEQCDFRLLPKNVQLEQWLMIART